MKTVLYMIEGTTKVAGWTEVPADYQLPEGSIHQLVDSPPAPVVKQGFRVEVFFEDGAYRYEEVPVEMTYDEKLAEVKKVLDTNPEVIMNLGKELELLKSALDELVLGGGF